MQIAPIYNLSFFDHYLYLAFIAMRSWIALLLLLALLAPGGARARESMRAKCSACRAVAVSASCGPASGAAAGTAAACQLYRVRYTLWRL